LRGQQQRAGLRSQLDDIEGELAEYDALSQGQITELEADSIVGIGQALIKARIVRNLNQRELAERLSLAEQQVQRYEATLYRGGCAKRSRSSRADTAALPVSIGKGSVTFR
jgi:hypothetical protein